MAEDYYPFEKACTEQHNGFPSHTFNEKENPLILVYFHTHDNMHILYITFMYY